LTRFSEHGKVNFGDISVEAEDGLEMGFGDTAREASDYNHLRVRLFNGVIPVHVNVGIAQRMGGS